MTERSCRFCGKALARSSRGRPPDYCSAAHRRMAEVERARLERQLERLDDARRQWRQFPFAADKLALVEGDIAAKTARLEALLGADSPASE